MRYNNIYGIFNPIILSAFLLFTLFQNSISAQINTKNVYGYGKASYDAAQTGKFMKSWLLAGPFSVSADSLEPDDAYQEKVFKEDMLSAVNVVPVNHFHPFVLKRKISNLKCFHLSMIL